MEAGFSAGHCVVLENESDGDFNQRFTEGTWDGLPLEIAGRETATSNNMLSGLSHCASKPKTKVALLYLPKEFSHKVFYRTLQRYKGLKKVNNGQYREFERIICIHKGVIVVDCAL
jgi:hypothetical protein